MKPINGYITKEGEIIPIDSAARLIPMAEANLKEKDKLLGFLMSLARQCFEKGMLAGAQAYFEKIYELAITDDTKAYCLLSIGQMKEMQDDYESALAWYQKAFSLTISPCYNKETWYLLHNNLGYCLNHFGQHAEAAKYCNAAISINPNRHNAHKNLGIALEGLGDYAEAAKCYLMACKLCPDDPRALNHLEELLASHPEIAPDLKNLMETYKQDSDISWN